MAMQLFTGKQYLQMDVAGNFGLDNQDWDVRLQWFEDHKDNLEGLMKQAKEPALYYAAVQAWRDVEAGKPSGYPISLDATCSGLQILTVLTGDRLAAMLCNVLDAGYRADAYTSIYKSMTAKLGQEGFITRNKTKDAILTALYGSEAIPKKVFGTGILLGTFFETMKEEAPAAWELNEMYLAIWDPSATMYSWILPDNFHVHCKVMGDLVETVHFLDQPYDISTKINTCVEKGRSLGANTTHSIDGMIVREMVRRCSYDPKVVARVMEALNHKDGDIGNIGTKEDSRMVSTLWCHYEATGYLSARILDHIREGNLHLIKDRSVIWELIDSLPDRPFQLITIHDCFRCLPNYGNDLRKQYNLQLSLIAKSNLLSSIFSQLLGRKIEVNKQDNSMATEILNANYALS